MKSLKTPNIGSKGTFFAIITAILIAVILLFVLLTKGFSDKYELIVEPNDTPAKIASTLDSNNLYNGKIFYYLLRTAQLFTDKGVKTGYYELSPDIGILTLITNLLNGDSIKDKITFIEGITFDEAISIIKDHQGIKKTLTQGKEEAELIELLKVKNTFPEVKSMEGLLLSDTYVFSKGSSDIQVLGTAYKGLVDFLVASWVPSSALKTPYEALTLASIIEKETGVPEERPLISSVFYNRLNIGMRLQTDPTVIYGVVKKDKNYDGNLKRSHLQDPSNIYNTYQIKAFPPTPISLVGKDAITAAIHPSSSEYIYFVAKGDGSHVFSITMSEHIANVKKYQLNIGENYTSTHKKQ